MFARMSFRSRLFLACTAVILTAMVLPAFFFRSVMEAELLDDAKAAAVRQLDAAVLALEQNAFRTRDEARDWIMRTGPRLQVRVTYIDAAGVVLADSEVNAQRLGELDSHADRPEVLGAALQEHGVVVRYSSTLDRELIYAARRVRGGAGLPDGVLRIAVPYAGLRLRLEGLTGRVFLVMALAVGLGLGLSWALTRRLSRSVGEMVRVAEGIGQGDYHRRLRFYPGREFEGLADAVNSMAANIAGQIQTITAQKTQLEAVLDAMREGVLVLDEQGRIRQMNRAMGSIAPGIARSLGKRPLEAILSPELQQACERMVEAPAQGEPDSVRLEIEPERGRVYDVHVVRVRSGEAGIGALAVFHDISELKRLELVRRDFVANVSHELRTPLTTVKGYAETLLDNPGADPERTRSFLEVIHRNADHMARMVEDLLSLSRMESGRQAFSREEVDPAEAVAEALRTSGSLAEAKGIAVDLALSGEGVRVTADHGRLAQVFRNLLENAFKYGPPGSRVSVSARREGRDVVFSVADTGPGIPREEQSRVFERFYRVEKHRARDGAPSTGLGLAICKHIVECLGGRIWLQSPAGEGGGTVFSFSLPAAQFGPGDSLAPAASASGGEQG